MLLESRDADTQRGNGALLSARQAARLIGVSERYVRPVTTELGIELGGWHDFRHTVATSLLRAGHGVKVVSELLGHSDVAITLRTYDHVESDAFRAPLNQTASQLL